MNSYYLIALNLMSFKLKRYIMLWLFKPTSKNPHKSPIPFLFTKLVP